MCHADVLTGASLTQYLRAVGVREANAIRSLKLPKQNALFCGPELYVPDSEKKLIALARYQQIVDTLIPKDTTITTPYLWHNDLHDDNIFVDPNNPEKITGIIDWQSCHISPLFNQNPDPAFLDWDGLEPETLDLAPRPQLAGLSPEERSAAVHEYPFKTCSSDGGNSCMPKTPICIEQWNSERLRRTVLYFLPTVCSNTARPISNRFWLI